MVGDKESVGFVCSFYEGHLEIGSTDANLTFDAFTNSVSGKLAKMQHLTIHFTLQYKHYTFFYSFYLSFFSFTNGACTKDVDGTEQQANFESQVFFQLKLIVFTSRYSF